MSYERLVYHDYQSCFVFLLFQTLCGIWYHLCNLKNVKNTHGGVLLLVTLQTLVCNSTKSNTLAWVFFTIFKLRKWYQIVQSITYLNSLSSLTHQFYQGTLENTVFYQRKNSFFISSRGEVVGVSSLTKLKYYSKTSIKLFTRFMREKNFSLPTNKL